jgi:uncharacterized repeat protein (TIGR03806 family)
VSDAQCAILSVLWELSGRAADAPTCLGGDAARADLDCSGLLSVVDIQVEVSVVLGAALGFAVDADANGCADACEAACSQGLHPGMAPPVRTGCVLPPEANTPGELALAPAFPTLPPFSQPLYLTHAGDGSGRLFVVEQGGVVQVVKPATNGHTVSPFLDISAAMATQYVEGGLMGLAFHPNFDVNGEFFVLYVRDNEGQVETVLSRFSVSSSDPDAALPSSEQILLVVDQPFPNHNGGWIGFGPDGFLYITFGDGGGACGVTGDAQDPSTARGSILRIDVDTESPELPYGVPADNPFVGAPPARPETWAYGFRNPWRGSFDRATGAFWVGDVGQGAVEEINVITPGGNYGWNVMEGVLCQPPTGGCAGLVPACVGGPFVDPVAEYGHDTGLSVTGGYVYRGTEVADLVGAYVYGDFVTGGVFVWHYAEQAPPQEPTLFAPQSVASFGEDESGELYVVGYQGNIYKVTSSTTSSLPAEFPDTLSATGCFSDLASLTPAAGVLPYSPRAELWSDGAIKHRWVALPPGEKATYTHENCWEMPVGTTFVKHFEVQTIAGDPTSRVRLETRLLAVEEAGVRGYTYRWNEAGTEAYLLGGAASRTLSMTDALGNTSPFVWQFPSRPQCRSCHTPASGGVLGFETRQLNHPIHYGCASANQLDAWRAWGLVEGAPAGLASTLPAFANPHDESQSASARARAYLHVNCGTCHRPGGSTGTAFDLRGHVPTASMGVVGVPAQKSASGEAPLLVHPGSPDDSELVHRFEGSPPLRMPPLGTSSAPASAVDAIRAWIAQVSTEMPCPPHGSTGKPTQYGLPWANVANTKFYTAAGGPHLYMAWEGHNLGQADAWLALRWSGAATAAGVVGGVDFSSSPFSAVVVVRGSGNVCLWRADNGGASCAPANFLQHYAGSAALPSTTLRVPWSTLGLPAAPAAVEVLAWVTSEDNAQVLAAAPSVVGQGPAPLPAQAWQSLSLPTCLSP